MKLVTLPEIIEINEFGGDYHSFNDAVYAIFRNDFVINKHIFEGKRLGLKAHPIVDGKEYTYYHFTHSGDIENERIPDFRRMERMGYPKPIIDKSKCISLKVWRNKRGRKNRILILHEEAQYLVILDDRIDFILPWTAYFIEYKHRLQKYLKEYEEYINAETAD